LLGLKNIRLELNTLGTSDSRNEYRSVLVEYLTRHKDLLDEDSLRRLDSNPLRVLDSKNPAMQEMIEAAPKLMDYLDQESKEHFETLKSILDGCGIEYTINPRLVRGLDYYCKTVFEWVTDDLGAQGTVCAGGRYDGLVEQLGGKPTPAAGFAMGIERLLSLLEDAGKTVNNDPDVFVIMQGEQAQLKGLSLVEMVRDQLPHLVLQTNCGGGSFKSQMKKANKSGATIAILLGEDEVASGTVGVKFLREDKEQLTIKHTQLADVLKTI